MQNNAKIYAFNCVIIYTYYLNNLFNRQYVFEYPFDANTKVFKETLKYNMVNIRYFGHPAYPKSIEEAKAAFDSKTGDRPYFPFNYNITNSSLPKYIFTNDDNMIYAMVLGFIRKCQIMWFVPGSYHGKLNIIPTNPLNLF